MMTSSTSDRKRDNAINFLRGISIIYVVANHSMYMPVSADIEWIVHPLQRFFAEGTTLFILISGYLFYYLKDSYEYSDYMIKKFKNVLLPYLLVSIPGILIYSLSLKDNHNWMDMDWFSDLPVTLKVSYLYLTGAHLGPFWYVPVIIMVFASSPLTLLLIRRCSPWLLAIFCLIISYFISRPIGNSDVLVAYGHFYPIFILGAILCKCRDVWICWMRNRVAFVFVVFFYILLLFSVKFGVDVPPYFEKILVFLMLYYLILVLNDLRDLSFLNRFLSLLAVYSFPLYFVHGYIVATTRLLWGDIQLEGSFEYVIFSFFVFFFSLLISALLVTVVAVVFKENSNKVVGLNYKEYLKVSPI